MRRDQRHVDGGGHPPAQPPPATPSGGGPRRLRAPAAPSSQRPAGADADDSVPTELGSYRFDDPDGEVGTETHLLATADGQVLQVPLTCRGAPWSAQRTRRSPR
ncbi:maltokinase N-terminal cap-like domain-containing protein [Kineococcus mangrovi]|uniref:maltokinase N-terminal cap-like domain-containing protein n=1 Tax=Kineococcus mangrovi TaxID=1660183 RepID=UPI003D7E1D08